jgi:hypothetical protein
MCPYVQRYDVNTTMVYIFYSNLITVDISYILSSFALGEAWLTPG